jgi:hypothetical protein
MARHLLALGGNTRDEFCFGSGLLPSVPFDPDQPIEADARRNGIDFSILRCVDFGCGDSPCSGCVTAECKGSIALADYLSKNPIVVGDVVDLAYLPRLYTLREVYWRVEKAVTPMTFDLQVADYNGAAPPIVLATGISGAALNWDVLDVATITGGVFPIRTNGVLQMVITDLPPPAPANQCGCPMCGGICGLGLKVAAVVRQYETGCN